MDTVKNIIKEHPEYLLLFKNISYRLIKQTPLVTARDTPVKTNLVIDNDLIKISNEGRVAHLATPVLTSEANGIDYLKAIDAVLIRELGETIRLKSNSFEDFELKENRRSTLSVELSLSDAFMQASGIQFTEEEMNQFKENFEAGKMIAMAMIDLDDFQGAKIELIDPKNATFLVSKMPVQQENIAGITDTLLRFIQLIYLAAFFVEFDYEFEEEFEKVATFVSEFNFDEKDKNVVAECILRGDGDYDSLEFEEYQERVEGYYQNIWDHPFELPGFGQMELSTQLMLATAIKIGIGFQVIDPNDQFVKLMYQDHTEFVKNTNMTSLDNYVAPLAMENKTVTKEILKQAGFRVPRGKEFTTEAEALNYYNDFKTHRVVVKPKSTNYGLGISIFEPNFSKDDFKDAVSLAFKEDKQVLVEEFIAGTEYRFYVLDGKVEGIILRIPANVVGDGKHTINELVDLKNQDPIRGTKYRKPLQKIALGDIEKLMLRTQSLTEDSIPEAGQVVYLRENSNVSTGGDSIDMTDEVDESYKKIAADAVAALGAFVSGIDLMIPDKEKVTNQYSLDYGIIEANFNPAIHMHMYPFKGKSRPLARLMLEKLFTEAKEG